MRRRWLPQQPMHAEPGDDRLPDAEALSDARAEARRLWQYAEANDRQRHHAEQQAELARLAARAEAASRQVRSASRRRYRGLARLLVLTGSFPVAA